MNNLLVVDIAHPDALLRALIADNVITPHRVRQTQAAGLRRSVDGDKGYSGLMTKTPEHIAWDSHWGQDTSLKKTDLHFQ